MNVKWELTGVNDLLRALEQTSERVAATGLKRALNKAAPIVLDDMKRLASKETGALRDSLTFVVKGRKTRRYAIIGPDSKATYQTPKGIRKPSRYAHLVENGHSGTVAANPFIRPAVDANRDRCVQVMGDELKATLERAAQRANRGVKRGK